MVTGLNMFIFAYECTLRHDIFLVVCRVFCAKVVKVVGVTSKEAR